MSVKLRLTRMGNKKRSFFRIVATNTASRRDGRPLEFLGYYNPQVSPADIKIDTDKVQKWMDLGAAFADGWRGSASKIPAARLENTCFPESLCR